MNPTENQASLIVGTSTPETPNYCADDLLTQEQASNKALIVSYQPVHRWAEQYESVWDSLDVCLVKVQRAPLTETHDEVYDFDIVRTSSDLTSISLTISDVIGQWREKEDGLPIAFCFDSITHALVDYPLKNVFRFCHAVSRYVLSAGEGHFHINRDAHEEKVVERFKVIFDDVIEVGGG